MSKVKFVVAALAAFLLLLALSGSNSLLAQGGQLHNCPQPGKWAISVWEGDNGVDTGQALATCGVDSIDAAYHLVPDTQEWLRYFIGHPEINNLQTLDNWQGIITHGRVVEPTPTPTSTPTTACTPEELFLSDIAVKFGGYGDMRPTNVIDRDTFTMTVVEGSNSQHWASVGIDLLDFWDWGTKPGKNLSCYKYMVVHAKGAVGSEEFRIGLGIMPVDYLYDRGLTTQWQDITFDMEEIWTLAERSNVSQVGFEIGPDWTDNAYGTTIHIDGVTFTNQPSAIVVP